MFYNHTRSFLKDTYSRTLVELGVFGSLMGTPIINRPQSAFFCMHATKKRPVVVDDTIVIRPYVRINLHYLLDA